MDLSIYRDIDISVDVNTPTQGIVFFIYEQVTKTKRCFNSSLQTRDVVEPSIRSVD